MSDDAGIEHRTVATSAVAVRKFNHSARSHPHLVRSHPHLARSHPHLARSHPHSARSHPHSARSHPHSARSQPHSARSHPHLARSHPHSARSHPHSAWSHPRRFLSLPQVPNCPCKMDSWLYLYHCHTCKLRNIFFLSCLGYGVIEDYCIDNTGIEEKVNVLPYFHNFMFSFCRQKLRQIFFRRGKGRLEDVFKH
jgi:hypothetical protein